MWPVVLLLVVQIKWWCIPGFDAPSYLSIARHMAGGELARFDGALLHHAFGYPLILCPSFWWDDRPFLIIALIHCVLALLLMWGLYLWTRRLVGQAAPLFTTLVMVNVTLWTSYRFSLSELAFMTELVWAVNALYAAIESRSFPRACLMGVASIALQIGVMLEFQLYRMLEPKEPSAPVDSAAGWLLVAGYVQEPPGFWPHRRIGD